jgi:hypothetical protein
MRWTWVVGWRLSNLAPAGNGSNTAQSVLRKYGSWKLTIFNGSVTMLPESRLSEIVDDLRREGFVVRSAKNLGFH